MAILIPVDASSVEFERLLRKSARTEGDSSSVPGEAGAGKALLQGLLKWSPRGGPLGSLLWQRGAPTPGSAADLEEPVLLGCEGLRGSRGSVGPSQIVAASVYRLHTQLLCVDVSGVD